MLLTLAKSLLSCALAAPRVTGAAVSHLLGKHQPVKALCDCHVLLLCAVGISGMAPCDWLDFTFPLTSSKGTLSGGSPACQLISEAAQAAAVCSPGCDILRHTLPFDVAQGGCSPPAPCGVTPHGAMSRRVRTVSTALVVPPLPPLHFSLPVAITARQHKLTIAQANPWNK